MYKYLPLLLIAVFILPRIANCQQNFSEVLIITTSNEEIKGFIDYRDWEKNPKEIKFKKIIDQELSETFSPSDIKSFKLANGKTYVGKVVLSDKSYVTDFKFESIKKTENDTVFLDLLVEGRINLLHYKDER